MGLHSISEDASMISFHCPHPDCSHHNCAEWEDYMECPHHDSHELVLIPAAEMRQRLAGAIPPDALASIGDTVISQPRQGGRKKGKTHQHPTDHKDIEWTGPGVVALPPCGGTLSNGQPCTMRTFIKVDFTEQELKAENITIPVRDDKDPTKITGFREHPMVARHKKLAAHLRKNGKDYKAPGGAGHGGQVPG
jgi:hypothetical protein